MVDPHPKHFISVISIFPWPFEIFRCRNIGWAIALSTIYYDATFIITFSKSFSQTDLDQLSSLGIVSKKSCYLFSIVSGHELSTILLVSYPAAEHWKFIKSFLNQSKGVTSWKISFWALSFSFLSWKLYPLDQSTMVVFLVPKPILLLKSSNPI